MNFIKKWIDTDAGKIPEVYTSLDWKDKLDTVNARLTFGRMNYKVEPGIYAVGNPDPDSNVFVTANYKMSFDALRSKLSGMDAWILVLDTKGINVWCAAGKGTFGTKEIVERIEITGLKKIVNHRRIIVPQLGAPGVSAYQVKNFSGFSVVFGPVRASDIPEFVNSGLKAKPEMRQVKFTFFDRLILVPAEIVLGWKYLLIAGIILFLISGINKSGYSFELFLDKGIISMFNLLLIYFSGIITGPLLLPWLPGRSFSVKGVFSGLTGFAAAYGSSLTGNSFAEIISWFLLFAAMSSFLTMNFTGASTYTSLSGVKKEMKYAIPLQVTGIMIGLTVFIVFKFV